MSIIINVTEFCYFYSNCYFKIISNSDQKKPILNIKIEDETYKKYNGILSLIIFINFIWNTIKNSFFSMIRIMIYKKLIVYTIFN